MSERHCPFCRPERERVCYDGVLVRAVWDIFPVTKGHALIVPKRHVPTWFDATREEQLELIEAIDQVRQIIAQRYHPDGYNIGINIGEVAGQTIFHLHVHLIPRYRGDMDDPTGGVRHVIPSKGNYRRSGRTS